jgi:hypothetical protein
MRIALLEGKRGCQKKQFDSVLNWYRSMVMGGGALCLLHKGERVGAPWGLDCQTDNKILVSPVGTVLKLVALLLAVVTVPRSASTSLFPFYM